MSEQREEQLHIDDIWHSYMMTGKPPDGIHLLWFESPLVRPIARYLPTEPRCKLCHYPFAGVGGTLVRTFLGLKPSKMNPQMCNVCEQFAQQYQGGAEVEATLLFADVRGSTRIAADMRVADYGRLIDRFYRATTRVLHKHYGMVEKLIGDEVTAFFVPGFLGDKHAAAAVDAGKEILRATGHRQGEEPWIPVGVGVHTGRAYVGTVGTGGGGVDIAVLGEDVNTAAFLAEQAGVGEIWFSEVSRSAAGIATEDLEPRKMTYSGWEGDLGVWALETM